MRRAQVKELNRKDELHSKELTEQRKADQSHHDETVRELLDELKQERAQSATAIHQAIGELHKISEAVQALALSVARCPHNSPSEGFLDKFKKV